MLYRSLRSTFYTINFHFSILPENIPIDESLQDVGWGGEGKPADDFYKHWFCTHWTSTVTMFFIANINTAVVQTRSIQPLHTDKCVQSGKPGPTEGQCEHGHIFQHCTTWYTRTPVWDYTTTLSYPPCRVNYPCRHAAQCGQSRPLDSAPAGHRMQNRDDKNMTQ